MHEHGIVHVYNRKKCKELLGLGAKELAGSTHESKTSVMISLSYR